MAQSFLTAERRLLHISVELLGRMAEIRKLRAAIQSKEVSKLRRPRARRLIASAAENQLRAQLASGLPGFAAPAALDN
jgi:hypothetical protein